MPDPAEAGEPTSLRPAEAPSLSPVLRCAIVAVILPREHLPYIRQWCLHHLAQGWSIHLYNNQGSTGSLRKSSQFAGGNFQRKQVDKRGHAYGRHTEHLSDAEVLEAFRDEIAGLGVTLTEWQPRAADGRIVHGQVEAYVDFIRRERENVDWAAFIDADEYLRHAPGLGWDEILTSMARRSCHRLVLGGVTYESRWSSGGEPRRLEDLKCCGTQKGGEKNIVRLTEVLQADIHYNWTMEDGDHHARADIHQFWFDHYRQKNSDLQLKIRSGGMRTSWDESLAVDDPESIPDSTGTPGEAINIALRSGPDDFPHLATVLASVLRRTDRAVNVKCWCDGFLPASFTVSRLSVEFLEATSRGIDRLSLATVAGDWRRCLFLEAPMVMLGDPGGMFDLNLQGAVAAVRRHEVHATLAEVPGELEVLPASHLHCGSRPWFHSGFLLDLSALRSPAVASRLGSATSAMSGPDERIVLCAVIGNRLRELPRSWHLSPHRDPLSSCFVSGGMVQWLTGTKPWSDDCDAWSRHLWRSERSTWQHLREGLWEKPASLEVSPGSSGAPRSLFLRGWSVRLTGSATGAEPFQGDLPHVPDFTTASWMDRAKRFDQVRFGHEADPAGWLSSAYAGHAGDLPLHVVIAGPVSEQTLENLWHLGYRETCRIATVDWPDGGPIPHLLPYEASEPPVEIPPHHDLYLKRSIACPVEAVADPLRNELWDGPDFGFLSRGLSRGLARYLRQQLPELVAPRPVILNLGPGKGTRILHEALSSTRIVSLEHDPVCLPELEIAFCGSEGIELLATPEDPVRQWHTWDRVQDASVDVLFVSRLFETPVRHAALFFRHKLKPGSIVILEATNRDETRAASAAWERSGFQVLERQDGFTVLRTPATPIENGATSPLAKAIGKLTKRCHRLRLAPVDPQDEAFLRSLEEEGVTCESEDLPAIESRTISWAKVKGMIPTTADPQKRHARVMEAMSHRTALVNALRRFLASGEETALICTDSCQWDESRGAVVEDAVASLPDDWGLLYFGASPLSHSAIAPHLTRLESSTLSPAVLWKRQTAMRLIPQLEAADCEWQTLLAKSHAWIPTYCVVPFVARILP